MDEAAAPPNPQGEALLSCVPKTAFATQGATAPPDPPDWRLRGERPYRPPGTPRLAPPARQRRQSGGVRGA
eukprot:4792322-Alexandrium_andersonii.AAC.1